MSLASVFVSVAIRLNGDDLADMQTGSFYRAAIPQDVTNGQPTPSTWGEPVAYLLPDHCDPITNFINHSIIFGTFYIWLRFRTILMCMHRHHLLRYVTPGPSELHGVNVYVGDWAGNDYATSGCPGTCAERIMDPSNFNVRIHV